MKMNEDKRRDGYYRKYYGITLKDYELLLQSQEGRCFCCNSSPETKLNNRGRSRSRLGARRLSVDHDHVTGEIRGLLCFKCNHLLIGRHRDPNTFQQAADYLRGPFTGFFVPEEYLTGRKKKRRKKKK